MYGTGNLVQQVSVPNCLGYDSIQTSCCKGVALLLLFIILGIIRNSLIHFLYYDKTIYDKDVISSKLTRRL